MKIESVLVLCVDRDNDLGKKANVEGPIVGRKNNLNAAAKLAIADPGDSDVNCIFGAVKKFDEVRQFYEKVEIATLTGQGKSGFESDRKINEQLDKVLEKFNASAFILVTDGAEDDQVIPILQGRAPIISKELIIVKQAREVESTYYAIKEALKDPFMATLVFFVPGLILIIYFALGSASLQWIALVIGLYLILKGVGLDEKIIFTAKSIPRSVSFERLSVLFYFATLFLLAFGIINGYTQFFSIQSKDIALQTVLALQGTYLFVVLAVLSFFLGKSIDAIHFRKAFYLRKYFLSGVTVVLIWFILDSGTQVIKEATDLNFFLISIAISFAVMLVCYRVSSILDVRRKITKLLVGLPVCSKEGKFLGTVETIDKKKKTIEYKESKTNNLVKIGKEKFVLGEGRIILAKASTANTGQS